METHKYSITDGEGLTTIVEQDSPLRAVEELMTDKMVASDVVIDGKVYTIAEVETDD